MKKSVLNVAARFLAPSMAAGIIFASCASNDTNPPGYSDAPGTDTSMMVNTDTMMSDKTRVDVPDSNSTMMAPGIDSLGKAKKDTAALKLDKKAKKGKVSILPGDKNEQNTAMEMDKEGFYKNTEVLPGFPGGQKALERFFEDNIIYPETATDNGTSGTVRLSFAVDETGKVYNPVAVGAKLGDGIEEEAIRVFKKMPTWTPGRIKGKNVKTRYTLPINFQLD